jgi:transposase
MGAVRFGVVEGQCWTEQVLDYLGGLAQQAEWERMGLLLKYLPRYGPHLNPMENVWRRMKGFLMPKPDINSKGIYVWFTQRLPSSK